MFSLQVCILAQIPLKPLGVSCHQAKTGLIIVHKCLAQDNFKWQKGTGCSDPRGQHSSVMELTGC